MKYLLFIVAAVIVIAVIIASRKKEASSGSSEKITTYKYVEGKGVVKIDGPDPDQEITIYRMSNGSIIRMSPNDVKKHISNLGYFAKLSGDPSSVAYAMKINSDIFHLDQESFMGCLQNVDGLKMFSFPGSDKETPLRLLIHYIYAAGLATTGRLSEKAKSDIYRIGLAWSYSTSDVNELIASLKS